MRGALIIRIGFVSVYMRLLFVIRNPRKTAY